MKTNKDKLLPLDNAAKIYPAAMTKNGTLFSPYRFI